MSPVAVICGGGRLPVEVIAAAVESGRRVVAIAIKGEADERIAAYNPSYLGWGQIGKLASLLEREGCRDVVMIGSVTRRPELRQIVGDLGTMRRLPKIIASLAGGDDSILTKIIRFFEDEGFRIIGAHEVAPGLLARPGTIVGKDASAEVALDLNLAIEAVVALGRLDIGQAAVSVAGRVIAVEGAEGTDAMLDRCRTVRERGRVKGKGGVLVKCAKPGQDMRVDLPTIGPDTIRAAANAGLSGIGIEAGRVLIAERTQTEALARELSISLWGVEPLDGAQEPDEAAK
ncbi:hypothetical protein SAMN05428979_1706 [Stappia sp. ES.058]|nr:hypothetical protein SAMN05428979_1706 [Stappia sp. ES.058]